MNATLKSILDRLPEVAKYGLVLGVVVFISFLFPNNVKFKYEFVQGQSWRYDDLTAPFDFAIKKTEAEIQAASAEIEREFSPFYQLNPRVAKTQKKEFQKTFDQQLESVRTDPQFNDVLRHRDRYLRYGNRFLDKIYNRGIIQLATEHQDRGKDFVINVVKGNTIQKRTLQSVWDVEKAKEMLSDSLPHSRLYVPEFLLYTLPETIVPNLFFNDSLTANEKQRLLAEIATTKGAVKKGELIIPKNGIVTADIFQRLVSFREKYEEEVSTHDSYLGVFGGYFLLTSLILGVFLMYLNAYAKKVLQRFSRLIFILLWLVIYSYLVYAIEKTNSLSSYMIPFCIVPIVIKHFFTDRLAFFVHIIVVLIASFLSSLGYEFTFIQILAGIVAVLAIADARNWSKFFMSVFYIFLAYAGAFLGLSLIQEGSFSTVDWSIYGWLFLNAFLTILAFPMIPLLERLFGFTSSISLMELSDMTRPLLKELGLKAPGTLQHSLQVANLSEAAANEIGADPLLVKVAALYHDVGKTLQPEYFIENQGSENPHEKISYIESAKIIIKHVTEGIAMAKKQHLPRLLIDFIRTHHGTTRVEYFYRNFVKENPEKEFDETLFRYPGPRPKSKEETILMLADSLEAASKSLKNPGGKDIDNLVDKIVAFKIENRQFEESEMTFEELEKCKIVFKLLLRSINHVRVEYPSEVQS